MGDHLKRRRLDSGLYQKDVAASLKVSNRTICNWENNETIPAVRFLPRIIAFLEYDPFATPQCLGEEVARTRRQLGLSRKRLARKLHMDEMTLARVEEGALKPRDRHLTTLTEFVSTGSETA